MAKFKIYNPDLSREERTYLEADYSSGTSLTVRNNEGLTTNYFVVVGEPGQEQTELRQITGSSGNDTITISSALRFSHPKSTPVYLSRWDKWAVERSATQSGTYAGITDSPFNIEWDDADLTTTIIDDSGDTTYFWKWRPLNSATSTYGTYSDVLPGTGLGRLQVGYMLQQVKKNSLVSHIKDEDIVNYFNDFQDLVYEKMPDAWWFTKRGTAVSTVASDYDYSVSGNWSDYVSMKFFLYRYVSGDIDITYPLTWVPLIEFYNLKADANKPEDDYVKSWTLLPFDSNSAKGYLGIDPTPESTSNYVIPVYNYAPSPLDSFGDTAVIPSSKGYIDYAFYRIFDEIMNDTTNADKYSVRVEASLRGLRKRMKKQSGQPEFARFRGHRGFSRQFGEQSRVSSSDMRELYW